MTPIESHPHCVAFWNLGKSLKSLAPEKHQLIPRGNPIETVADGLFNTPSLHFNGDSWLQIPRDQLGSLNICGPKAQVTVVSWIKWEKPELYQALGGIWNESDKLRQFCLFLNITTRYDSQRNLHGHISHVGGPTPGFGFCITYATGATEIPLNKWLMLAMTYDASQISVSINGHTDTNNRLNEFTSPPTPLNPFKYEGNIFDGGKNGADFTIGGVDRSGEMGNWFHGLMNSFAVYNTALSTKELTQLANATVPHTS